VKISEIRVLFNKKSIQMNLKYIISLLCCLSFWGCKKTNRVVYPSFYYWKSTLHASDLDTVKMNQFGLKRLYIKYLDIDWNAIQGAQPRSITQVQPNVLPTNIEMVPVVFITNRVFLNLKSEDLPILADRLITQLKTILSTAPELQIDCDWSEGSRLRYFEFLTILKQKIHFGNFESLRNVSATIRLHQIKYRHKTGIPPVDRGMLMMYNFLKVSDFNDRNSIYETAEARKYLKNQKTYKLPLDVVLPIWSWAVAYREGKYLHLFNHLNTKSCDTLAFLEREKTPFFRVKQDTVFQKEYLRMGDRLKIEEISTNALQESAELARQFIQNDSIHVSFFHWDEPVLQNMPLGEMKKTVHKF
jgi:hypothetical protein